MDSGSIYSNMGPGMLGLEMSLHHQIPQQNSHHPMHHQPPHPHPQPHPIVHQETAKNSFPFGNKGKNQSLNFSDDDEPGNSAEDGKKNNSSNSNKTCPWQRMKWTDNMVRLLIMVVYYIGDEVGSEGNTNNDPSGKKKSVGVGGSGSGGVLQKKGKWKSVSRAMMERGFYVSPQQCEDKFNDLNKRYKRVNDILGKGTACRVVENQSLLETMDHLSTKMKEEVKKLLNSKHLFFREMCAYHNSCGHNSNNAGGAAAGGGGNGGGTIVEANSQAQLDQQQRCLHSSENPRIGASVAKGAKMQKGASGENDDEDDDEDDEDGDEEEDEDDEVSHHRNHHREDDDDDDDVHERSRKRQKIGPLLSPMVQQLSIELANVSPLEKRQWLKTKMMQLEEQHVGYMYKSFELQKQRLKWEKFTSKKEREMEKEKLINERKKLENERMLFLLKQKELELLDFHHHQHQQQPNINNRNSDPSSITG